MKLYYPLLLKDKLIKIIDYHHLTIGFCDELKAKILDKCIDLWLYIYSAQQRQFDNNFELKKKLNRMRLSPFDEGVPINKETLSRRYRIHRHLYYNHLLTILKDIDVIEVGDWYRVKGVDEGVPKSYKIKQSILKSYFGEFVWIEPTNIMDKYTHKSKEDWIKDYPSQKKLIENHYLASISIYSLEKELKGLVMLGELNQAQYFSYLNQSLMFNQKYFWFSRKNGNGRFYSSFTSLPRIIRKHLTIDGSFVCEIDLKNALPLFISYRLNHPIFKKDCLEGVLWDKITKELNIPRDEVKVGFLKHIVYKKETESVGYTQDFIEMYKVVESLYPGLYEMIEEIRNRGDIYEKYTDLESKIFVDGMKGFDFPYLTIHDALVVRNLPLDKSKATHALNYVFASKGLEVPVFHTKCV